MKHFLLFASCVFVAGCAAPRTGLPLAHAAPATDKNVPGEGADLLIGDVGIAPGQFDRLRDITFGPDGHLYTLESAGRDATTAGNLTGLGRVQVFDGSGELVRSFSLGDDAQAENAVNEKNDDTGMASARIAVDGQNRVYVSFPFVGGVRVFDTSGKKLSDIALPSAMALARMGDGKVVAVASNKVIRNNHWEWGWRRLVLRFERDGNRENRSALGAFMECAGRGCRARRRFAHSGRGRTRQIRLESSAAHLAFRRERKDEILHWFWQLTRSEDGSEPLHSLVVGKDGSITAFTYGNRRGWCATRRTAKPSRGARDSSRGPTRGALIPVIARLR